MCPPQYYQPPRIFRPCDGPVLKRLTLRIIQICILYVYQLILKPLLQALALGDFFARRHHFIPEKTIIARLEMITFRKVRIKLNAAILSCQKASKLIFFFLHQKFKLCKNLICYFLQRHRNIFKPKNITFYKKSSIDLPNFL